MFVPEGLAIRPLTDMMRGAVFSRLGASVVGARMLDLFSGTGAVGLEALSRGAKQVTLVERSRDAARVIERNLEKVMREEMDREGMEIVCMDVFDFIATREKRYDIIFAGPPYAKLPSQTSLAAKLLQQPRLPNLLSKNGTLIIERFKKEELGIITPWRCDRTLSHGDTRVEFLSKSESSR